MSAVPVWRGGVRGLTLLELLVTLVIVAMAAALLSQAMMQISRLELQLEESGAEPQAQMVRREWLRSAVASGLPELIGRNTLFTGDAGSVSLESVEALELFGAGVSPLRIRMASVAGQQQLQILPPRDAASLDTPAPIPLLSWRGEAGRIEYMDAEGRWQARWPADDSPELTRRPPRALRFMVGQEAGGPLVVAVGSNQGPRPSLADWMRQ